MRDFIIIAKGLNEVPSVIQQAATGRWPESLRGIEIFYMIVFIEAVAIAGVADAISCWNDWLAEEEDNQNWSHLKSPDLRATLQTVPLGSFEEREYGCADPETASHYAGLDTAAPPILIVNGSLQDGNHRVAAARQRGENTVLAYVVVGSQNNG